LNVTQVSFTIETLLLPVNVFISLAMSQHDYQTGINKIVYSSQANVWLFFTIELSLQNFRR